MAGHCVDAMTVMLKALVYALLSVIVVVTGVTSYWTHKDGLDRWQRVEELMTNPRARPDSWTKTDDDQRMAEYDLAIKAWVTAYFQQKSIKHNGNNKL